jgi:hypothetical protein
MTPFAPLTFRNDATLECPHCGGTHLTHLRTDAYAAPLGGGLRIHFQCSACDLAARSYLAIWKLGDETKVDWAPLPRRADSGDDYRDVVDRALQEGSV